MTLTPEQESWVKDIFSNGIDSQKLQECWEKEIQLGGLPTNLEYTAGMMTGTLFEHPDGQDMYDEFLPTVAARVAMLCVELPKRMQTWCKLGEDALPFMSNVMRIITAFLCFQYLTEYTVPTLREIQEMVKKDQELSLEDFTCFDCSFWKTCEYAFDGYNTGGDCLATK